MEKCEVNANEIKRLKERVDLLEKHREKDKSELHQLDTSLQVFINEMKNISTELKTIVSNFKEAIIRSTNAQEKEIVALKDKVHETEIEVKKLNNKLEQETVVADAKKWKKATGYILTAIGAAVLAIVFAKIGLN